MFSFVNNQQILFLLFSPLLTSFALPPPFDKWLDLYSLITQIDHNLTTAPNKSRIRMTLREGFQFFFFFHGDSLVYVRIIFFMNKFININHHQYDTENIKHRAGIVW